MIHHAGSNHVQIDVDYTAMQMLVGFNSGGMIAIFPEGPLSPLALVVFLRRAASDELHALSNHVSACVFDQKMNVVRGDHIVEHTQSKPLPRFEEPVEITPSIKRKLEQKLSLVAAVGNVPDVTREEITLNARGCIFLRKPLHG